MSGVLPAPRLMLMCDSAERAARVLAAVQREVAQTRVAAEWGRLGADFDAFQPDVLVFFFDSLARSEAAQRQLFRQSTLLLVQPYRTLLLCQADEGESAFELCLQGHFDDFAPWHGAAADTRRLLMGVHLAGRRTTPLRSGLPSWRELQAHVRHLGRLEAVLDGLLEAPPRGPGDALATEVMAMSAQLQTALAGTRALRDKVDRMRPLVLVVDDDALARRLIAHTLDPQRYELHFAVDGIDALNQMRRLRPDVLLTDVRMPGLDGVSLTQRLKAEPELAGIPVILMTADASRETLASSIDVGAAAFLPKPYTRESLTARLDKTLGRGARPGAMSP